MQARSPRINVAVCNYFFVIPLLLHYLFINRLVITAIKITARRRNVGQLFYELFCIIGLPDDYTLFGSNVEFVAGIDAEGFNERHNIAECNIHAVFCQRVHIVDCEVAFLFVTDV